MNASSMHESIRQQHPGTRVEEIPVIDLGEYFANGDGALACAAQQLCDALENIGFFCIVNHCVPQSLIDRTFEQTRRFHDLPHEAKMDIAVNRDNVGFMPTEGELVRTSPYAANDIKADVGEALFVKRDRAAEPLAVENQWPEDLPGFRDTVVEYYNAMERLAQRLLPIYAVALDVEPQYFDAAFPSPNNLSILRMAHFPPDPLDHNQFNVGPHTDSSFFTLLPATALPGLELYCQSGNWFLAQPPSGAIIVNAGDMLTRWTNGRFLSTPHRVRSLSGRDRYSIPLFYQPNPEQIIECLPSCRGADRPVPESPISARDYFDWFMQQNFAHASE